MKFYGKKAAYARQSYMILLSSTVTMSASSSTPS